MRIMVMSPNLQDVIRRLSVQGEAEHNAITTGLAFHAAATADLLAEAAPHGNGSGEGVPGDAPGPLAKSFEGQLKTKVIAWVVTTQPGKLSYVTQGTGLYGEHHARIVPRRARVLYWDGADHPVRSVRGMRGKDFVRPIILRQRQSLTARLRAYVKSARERG